MYAMSDEVIESNWTKLWNLNITIWCNQFCWVNLV